jgi:cell division protein FtsB
VRLGRPFGGVAADASPRLTRPVDDQARPPLGLTPRGAVLVLVMFALAVTAVYPLRQYVTQRDRIERLQAKQRALQAENERLERERARLRDPAYVQQLAKRDFHLVEPGEEAWVMRGTPPAATAPPAAPATPAPKQPWYKRAWQRFTGWLR